MPLPGRILPFSGCHTLHSAPRSWRDAVTRLRFVGGFLLIAWPTFLLLVRSDGWIPGDVQANVGFVVSMWESDAARAAVVSHIGIVVQHSWPQMIYVTILFLAAGVAYELREGSLRALLVFYGATLTGVAILTTVVLLGPVVPGVSPLSQHAAAVSWSGASVGCFGLLGALAATARNPWPLLLTILLFEVTVELALIPTLALVMHGAGFAFGFVVSRLAHVADAPAETPVGRSSGP